MRARALDTKQGYMLIDNALEGISEELTSSLLKAQEHPSIITPLREALKLAFP